MAEGNGNKFWQGKTVLCTGGSGFLGSHLLPLLTQAGARVIAPRSAEYDLRYQADVIDMYEEAGGAVPTHRGPKKARARRGGGAVDILFHLAATVGGIGANMRYPADFVYDNAMMNALVCEFARRFEVGKLVTVGSVCAYPKACPIPFREENLWEGYPEETNAPYGETKRMLLVHLQALRREYGFNGIYLLPTNLYGERDHSDPETSHVIPALIRKMGEAQRAGVDYVEAWGTGAASRDFLYAGDCAQALMLAAQRYNRPEPVNLGSGREVTIAGLVEILKQAMGFEGRVVFDASKPDGQPRRCLNTSRAWEAFGWKAETALEDGLRRTIKWWQAQEVGRAAVAWWRERAS